MPLKTLCCLGLLIASPCILAQHMQVVAYLEDKAQVMYALLQPYNYNCISVAGEQCGEADKLF